MFSPLSLWFLPLSTHQRRLRALGLQAALGLDPKTQQTAAEAEGEEAGTVTGIIGSSIDY
jgi:hypothetical protein